MKKYTLLLSLCLFGLLFINADNPPKVFEVWIEQDGQKLPVKDHEVLIDRAPFKIVFGIGKPFEIAVSASFRDSITWKLAHNFKLDSISAFNDGGGYAEKKNNETRDMSFSEEGFNYWYYENKKDNRFDKVVKSGNTILCYRSIDTLCFYPKESGAKFSYSSDNSSLISLPVNKIRESGIYLAIISWEQQPNDKRKELQRDWLHVVFH